PPWLLQINVPYNKSSDIEDTESNCVEEERRMVVVTFQTNIEPFQPLLNLDNYSNLDKVIRITSYVLRFANNCRPNREKVRPGNQIMAPLPSNRIQASYPFENVGIDFAGPIYTRNIDKAYIALFTCAVTRAIHLEVVSSLSTEYFLLAFRRFISRRGICHTVNSDSAMTFISADIELKRLYMNICEPEVQNYFGKKGIKWQYIVECAAWWWWGLLEANGSNKLK
ncbi:hypothetical protein AVEN_154431-2-1, partial [Araneus ventricosus]